MKKILILGLVSMFFLSACLGSDAESGESAEKKLPDLEGYTTAEVTDVTAALQTFGVAADVITGDPAVAAQLALIDQYTACFAEVGVLGLRFYMNEENPQVIGFALIINETRLANPENLMTCLLPDEGGFLTANPEMRPCADGWRESDDEASYFMAYAGTSPMICDAFSNAMKSSDAE
jgi:hypothetical protein